MKKPSKPSFNHFGGKLKSRKQGFDYKDGILFIIAFTILTVSTIFMSSGNSKIYIIKVNNKLVGYVNKYAVYSDAIDKIKTIDKNVSLKNVVAEKTDKVVETFITTSTIEKAIAKEIEVRKPSIAIRANGGEIAIVSSKNDAKKVLDGVVKYYYPKVNNGKLVITSGKILEKISMTECTTDPKNVLSVNDAIKKIINGKGAKKQYKIKDGDTIWDVAIANNVAVEDIQAANPHINMDKIKIGQSINLTVNLPYLNVRITANIDSKEQIPFESKQVVDKKARLGSKKVKERGRNGLAEIIKSIVIENGDVINENIKSNKIVFAPQNEIIAVGRKSLLVAATGLFMRPSRGILSSPFGRRWGKMHEGIDLASPTGTPIEAANNGKVSFVGIRNGYGLCIMINHGNGLQTLYGHTSRVFVKTGQIVKKGQKIAAVGSTGHSTGPHLHFEVRKNGVPVNPLAYIK